MRKPLVIITFVAVLLFGFLVTNTEPVTAYSDGDLISDLLFRDKNSMDKNDIQNFLDSKGGALASWSGADASQVIYDASQNYGVNPRVIMATLQKEQSLITDPDPHHTQYDYAMGYGCPTTGDGCSYQGFTEQVDNGTWQLRLNYERARGNDNWWSSDIGYACNNGTDLYEPGLYPGNTVEFYDHTEGEHYATVDITNAATAALYCYTPHVYNPSGDPVYYSGSYNFVTSYEAWFGSTTTPPEYTWDVHSQGIYLDPDFEHKLPHRTTLEPNQKYYMRVKAENTGNSVWYRYFMRLGTSHPNDRASIFHSKNWVSPQRVAKMEQDQVKPGEVASFESSFMTPEKTGDYKEYFNLVAEGISWFEDVGLYFPIRVEPSREFSVFTNQDRTAEFNNNGIHTFSGNTLHVTARLRNETEETWPADKTRIATADPNDRSSVFANDSWMKPNRVISLKDPLAPGETAKLTFTMSVPGETGSFEESFGLVIEGEKWIESDTATLNIGVENHPGSQLKTGEQLKSNEQVVSPNGTFRLKMQSDGNLVLYALSQPLWASSTSAATRLYMQNDGNLVLYNTGKPLWASNTSAGSYLYMQNDGNLVLYGENGPLWASNTKSPF